MSDSSEDNQLDRFLDGIMSQQEAAEFLESANPEELEREQQLQSKIDESLKRLMSGMEIDEEQVSKQFLATEGTAVSTRRSVEQLSSNRRNWIQLAVAASLLVAVGLGVWMNSGSSKIIEPVFPVRALTDVYAEKVGNGFRPYYICDDPKRFADTFVAKVDIALALSAMPDDRKMLGLSYLGGISRNTVAMISEVQGEKVIVFVDRDDEAGIEKAIKSVDPSLNVFVERKFGLVFAEVTPLDSAGLIEYFETAGDELNPPAEDSSVQ